MNFLVPIPAFFFFYSASFLGRAGHRFIYAFSYLLLCPTTSSTSRSTKGLSSCKSTTRSSKFRFVTLDKATPSKLHANIADSILLRRSLFVIVASAFWQTVIGSISPILESGAHRLRHLSRHPRSMSPIPSTLAEKQHVLRVIQTRARNRLAHLSLDPAHQLPRLQELAGRRPLSPHDLRRRFDFHYFLLASSTLFAVLLIADVSGHGVPAELISLLWSRLPPPPSAPTPPNPHTSGALRELRPTAASLRANSSSAAFFYLNARTRELCYGRRRPPAHARPPQR